MVYVFDTSSFIVLSHYFPERFPSFWQSFDEFVSNGKILSVREVARELNVDVNKPHLREWMEAKVERNSCCRSIRNCFRKDQTSLCSN
ncbi:MAG: DUF4411 family protein [Calditrichaeota bacterium]|nr:DUF4411 family protein [Calditrichota bacterium]